MSCHVWFEPQILSLIYILHVVISLWVSRVWDEGQAEAYIISTVSGMVIIGEMIMVSVVQSWGYRKLGTVAA